MSVEHLCPRSRGGDGSQENCLLACKVCNNERKSKSAVSYAKLKQRQGFQPQWEILRTSLQALSVSNKKAHRVYAEAQLRHLS